LPFLHFVMSEPEFAGGKVNTTLVERLIARMRTTDG
jgi:hypothetical protein